MLGFKLAVTMQERVALDRSVEIAHHSPDSSQTHPHLTLHK